MTMPGRRCLTLIAAAALLATALPVDWAAAQRRERDPDSPPPGPVPRTADGKVMLSGATADEKGVWEPMFGIFDPIATPARFTNSSRMRAARRRAFRASS